MCFVAERLGMTVAELQEKMTPEELYVWSLYHQNRIEQEKASYEKASRRRR